MPTNVQLSRRSLLGAGAACALAATQGGLLTAQAAPPRRDASSTDATYFNNAAMNAADPHVLHDPASGYYYAYSTDGGRRDADGRAYHFGIYRSPDLATWEHLPGGALPADDPGNWGRDWFWAPEVYHNPDTGKYFLFYSARMRHNVAAHFGYANFEEPCKVGVAVADRPEGPFRNIAPGPIDYFPYDPDYHDVNLLMDARQMLPPATKEIGETAPLGTYIPYIDANVLFDDDGRQYLYYSRNAYRNWVWDEEFGKYIEESNIYVVELDPAWWSDPDGATMPTVLPTYIDANNDGSTTRRRDGFVPVLDYKSQPQAWENAHVNDYETYAGRKKDRRWEEGSTAWRVDLPDGETVYYMTYSANNWENEMYGVGYATAPSPLGPWTKAESNPILSQDPSMPMTGTGHGSIAWSPDGSEMFYVHHGRPMSGPRKLYTERMELLSDQLDSRGHPVLTIHQSVSDEPIPSGVAPYSVVLGTDKLTVERGTVSEVHVDVLSADGAAHDLTNPLNRVVVSTDKARGLTATVTGHTVQVTATAPGSVLVTVHYERLRSDGTWAVVHQGGRPVTGSFRVNVHG